MKKGDLMWGGGLLAVIAFLTFPATHNVFVENSANHPLIMAFIKFFVLGTMGEVLGGRIVAGEWKKPVGLFWRAVVWGVLGIIISWAFTIFSTGVLALIGKGMLPMFPEGTMGAKVLTAFFISLFMNAIFAPPMMGFHKITDTYLDLSGGNIGKISSIKLSEVVDAIDFQGLVGFVFFKTIPFFWVPAHTITFLLPPVYRVLMAAFLGIALGAILGFAKKNKTA